MFVDPNIAFSIDLAEGIKVELLKWKKWYSDRKRKYGLSKRISDAMPCMTCVVVLIEKLGCHLFS